MTDSVFHKIFLITCTGFRLRQRHQTAVLHLNLWKLPHGRYSPAKHHVSEVHLTGYASYFNKKSNLSSKLISRSKKLTSEQASWIFLKNYLGILRPEAIAHRFHIKYNIPQTETVTQTKNHSKPKRNTHHGFFPITNTNRIAGSGSRIIIVTNKQVNGLEINFKVCNNNIQRRVFGV